MYSILHRTTLGELIRVFVLAQLTGTGVMLTTTVLTEALLSGVRPSAIPALLGLLAVKVLPMTLPSSLLFATCAVYGRLARDEEVLALKAAGVHVFWVMWPGVLLGVLGSAATMLLYLRVVPSARYELRMALTRDVEDSLYEVLRQEGQIKAPSSRYSIFARRVCGRQLSDVIIHWEESDGRPPTALVAREAALRADLRAKPILVQIRHGRLLQSGEVVGQVEEGVWPLELPPSFAAALLPRPSEMSLGEVFLRHRATAAERQALDGKILAASARAAGGEPGCPSQELNDLREKRRWVHRTVCLLETELHMRPAVSLSCLCFVLAGCPVGIRLRRGDYLTTFATCFPPLYVLYYPALFTSLHLARKGLAPGLALWGADAAVVLTGAALWRWLGRN